MQHRLNKKGNGYGAFTLQDYVGSTEVMLFNEDYQKFKHLLEVGASVFVEGDYKPRYNGEGFELKIQNVRQLATISESMTEAITLLVPIEKITPEFIAYLSEMCDKHKGKQKLKVIIQDGTNHLKLNLLSKTLNVNIDADFVAAMSQEGLKYKLN